MGQDHPRLSNAPAAPVKAAPPPLRFLMLIVGGWACMRAAIFYPGRPPTPLVSLATAAAVPDRPPVRPLLSAPPPVFQSTSKDGAWAEALAMQPLDRVEAPPPPVAFALASASTPLESPSLRRVTDTQRSDLAPYRPPERPALENRWSGSAWIFVRRGGTSQLAAGGLLGGSQAGARLSYRLNRDTARPVALSARVYAPLASTEASEAAVGVSWKPIADLPIELLAERRQALGPGGRSAFSLVAYGGVSERPMMGPVRLDGYVQGGVVGLKSRDLFVDGSMLLTAPLDRSKKVRAGLGLWGAAQPGLSRLDVGPHVSARLGRVRARLTAEWRMRVAGSAAPASGPALTLSADF